MPDAYVETTILADLLLKPQTAKWSRAKAALAQYEKTLLPVYSIKEFKAGPLDNFAYLHDKLVLTKSYRDTLEAISSLPRGSYKQSTALEANTTAATLTKNQPSQPTENSTVDKDMADRYRLALAKIIITTWDKRRKVTDEVTDELECYTEASPRIGREGLFDLEPKRCDGNRECCLSEKLKAAPDTLKALRDAIPATSQRAEDKNRRKALREIIRKPNEPLDRDACRALGDAIFAFFCPKNAVILTTNIRDHKPLAEAIGKNAETPQDVIKRAQDSAKRAEE